MPGSTSSRGRRRPGREQLQAAARLDQHDAARLSAVHGGRRRRAAARRADGHLPDGVLGPDSASTRPPTISIRTWWRRWWRRSRRSCRHPIARQRLRPDAAACRRRRGSYARKLKLPYSSRLLTNPEANIRMGTAYLADKIKRVRRACTWCWPATTPASAPCGGGWPSGPASPRDEFIDDIPYPETQNYVKRILGTAEDYRRLYGGGARRLARSTRCQPAPCTGAGPAAPAVPAVPRQRGALRSRVAKKPATAKRPPRTGTAAPRRPHRQNPNRLMSKLTGSQESHAVHRVGHPRDDAAEPAARRRQPVAGVSRFSGAGGRQGRRVRGDPRRRQPVRRHLGHARRCARRSRASSRAATACRSSPTSRSRSAAAPPRR